MDNLVKGLCVAGLLIGLTGCGGSSSFPIAKQSPSTDNSKLGSCESPTTALSDIVNSNLGRWRVTYSWLIGPSMSDEDPLENKLGLVFKTSEEKTPDRMDDVIVTAFMPEHGHGTGNQLPFTKAASGGAATIENIWFSMTGRWEVLIKAKIDDVVDEARFCVLVKG
ncbi:MAG: hypothetical protein NTV34_08370 [Proteobacteria bacterium]|nr:hypothetical protein [Pseudomonadota bacterium]